jgi:hypothetical protein
MTDDVEPPAKSKLENALEQQRSQHDCLAYTKYEVLTGGHAQ